MKIFAIAFSLLFISLFGFSQTNDASKKIADADYYFNLDNFHLALPIYLQFADSLKNDASFNYKLGVCYFNSISEKDKALPFFEKSLSLMAEDNIGKPDQPNIDFYLYLGQANHLANNFETAISYLEKYKKVLPATNTEEQLKKVNHKIEMCKSGAELIKKPQNIVVINLGAGVNSPYPDFAPVITADESTLFFTSRREGTTGGQRTTDGQYYEDIYVANKIGESWTNSSPVGDEINTIYNDGSVGVSPDGQKLLVYRDNSEGGNVYESELQKGKWGKPKKLGSDINTKAWEPSAAYSPDGNTIYFVSDRKGGFGGRDIYKCIKAKDGNWSKAINLGATINTEYDEDAPFVGIDGKTLFFSSTGHNSVGGFDIFVSRLDLHTRMFQKPENLGFPVNTTDNDVFYVSSPDEKRAYISSVRPGGYGEKDIYMLIFPEKETPALTVYTGSIVMEDGSALPPGVSIVVVNMTADELPQIYRPNAVTGNYIFSLDAGKQYEISYQKEGTELKKLSFSVEITTEFTERQLPQVVIPVNKPIVKTEEPKKEIKQPEEIKAEVKKVEPEIKPKPIYNDTIDLRRDLITKDVVYTTKMPLYAIQLGAFKRSVPTATSFPGIKNVHSFIDTNNLVRYVVGNCATKSHAEAIRRVIAEKGYNDAFIVDINQAAKYKEEIVYLNNPKRSGNVIYKVQVGVFSGKIPDEIAERYTKIEGITEKVDGQLTYLLVGNFKDYTSADEFKKSNILNVISDAFVVAFLDGKKISIKEANEIKSEK
ncbi:MAG: hypothetical protein V4667_03755 [Bacteroidota bacterium]